MSSRKRKAEDDFADADRMSSSPSPTPANLSRLTAQARSAKKQRTNISGRPLTLPRLLETLSPNELRGVLQTVCERHPEIAAEIVTAAPRPTAESVLGILTSYHQTFQESFPYGDRPSSDYSFNRVRQSLAYLVEAIKDYTPHFLPPNESQASTSLAFLDGITEILRRIPTFDSFIHNRVRDDAYDETAKAWALVIKEAAKKGGGIQMQYNGWDQKLAKHNEESGGKLQAAINELQASLGWIASTGNARAGQGNPGEPSIRDQLFSGTYGQNPIQVGPSW